MNNNNKLLRAGLVLAYPLAYLYLRLIWFFQEGSEYIRFTVFAVAFILFDLIIVKGRGKNPPKETFFWSGVLILTALTSSVAPSPFVSALGLHLSAVYLVLVSCDILTEGRTGSFILTDLADGFFVRSFPNMGMLYEDTKDMIKNEDKKSIGWISVLYGLLIILLMLPLFILAVSLLGDINSNFAVAVNDLTNMITIDYETATEILMRLIFSVPVCLYLYGLISSSAKEDSEKIRQRLGIKRERREKRRRIPSVFLTVVTGGFAILYLIFFFFEGEYLTGGLWGKMPDGFNVVSYARQGFFELVGIMFINMLVYLAVTAFARREGIFWKISKMSIIVLMSESIVFSLLSFLKLFMYFYEYGYTVKRMLAMWGSLVLLAAALMVIISLIKNKDRSGIWIRFAAVSYIAMCMLTGLLTLLPGI